MSYWSMRKQTELYKKMAHQPYKDVTDKLIILETELAKKRREIEQLKAQKGQEAALSARYQEVSMLELQYRQEIAAFEKSLPKSQ